MTRRREPRPVDDDVDPSLTILLREKRANVENVELSIHRVQLYLEREQIALDSERLALREREKNIERLELEIEDARIALAGRRTEMEKERDRFRREVARRLPEGQSLDTYLESLWPTKYVVMAPSALGGPAGVKKRALEPAAARSAEGGQLRKKLKSTRPADAECPIPRSELLPWSYICDQHYQANWDRYVQSVGKGAVGRRRGKTFLPTDYLKSRFSDTWETFKVHVSETVGGTGLGTQYQTWHIPRANVADFLAFAEADTPRWPHEPRARSVKFAKAGDGGVEPKEKGKEKEVDPEQRFASGLPPAIPRVVVKTRPVEPAGAGGTDMVNVVSALQAAVASPQAQAWGSPAPAYEGSNDGAQAVHVV